MKYKDMTENAEIAGYVHDRGNAINRNHHAEYGAMIFLGRMMLCRKAAEILCCTFKLLLNGSKIL